MVQIIAVVSMVSFIREVSYTKGGTGWLYGVSCTGTIRASLGLDIHLITLKKCSIMARKL